MKMGLQSIMTHWKSFMLLWGMNVLLHSRYNLDIGE